jgi:GNAT superfamily N-acetyltransferase
MKLKDWLSKRTESINPVEKTVSYIPLLNSLEKSFGDEIYPVITKHISKDLTTKEAKKLALDLLNKSFNSLVKTEWIESYKSQFQKDYAEKSLQKDVALLIKGFSISSSDMENLILFDGLNKSMAEAPPKYVGERHSYKPYIGKIHSDGKLSWYYNDNQSKINDTEIATGFQNWLERNHSSENHPIIRQFFKQAMSSDTRHAVPARDKSPGPNMVRARHLKAIMQNKDVMNFNVSPHKISIALKRHIQGEPIHEWEFTPKGGIKDIQHQRSGQMAKSEDLEKGLHGDWKKEGYKIVANYNEDEKQNKAGLANAYTTKVFDKNNNHVGEASFVLHPNGDEVSVSSYVHPDHQRKGIATAMYQMAEKYFNLPIKAETQTSSAKALWSQPNRSFGKSEELNKAVDNKDWSKIANKHFEDGALTVNHKGHIEQSSVDPSYNHLLSAPQKFKGHKLSGGGISAKMVHHMNGYYDEGGDFVSTPQKTNTFMTKPYHRIPESHTKSWVDKPILGWATMTTKNLFNAGGIGHLAEDVHTHEHEGVPVTVHKFAKGYSPVATDETLHKKQINPDDLQKIAIMDYLTGNNDRHSGNILTSNHQDDEGYHKPLAIDHERNFQYKKKLNSLGGKYRPIDESETPQAFMQRPGMNHVKHQARWFSHEEPVNWWGQNKHKIKNQMEAELAHINDEGVRNHVRDNFNHRWEKLSSWADNLNSSQDFWNKDDFHVPFKDTRIIKQQAPKITSKFITDQFKGDPKAAINQISDIINSKGKLTANQHHAVKAGMDSVIRSLNPEQAKDLLNHALDNPKLNTSALRNHHLDLKTALLTGLSDNNMTEHMRSVADHIDSLPEEKKGSLPQWSEFFRRNLAR